MPPPLRQPLLLLSLLSALGPSYDRGRLARARTELTSAHTHTHTHSIDKLRSKIYQQTVISVLGANNVAHAIRHVCNFWALWYKQTYLQVLYVDIKHVSSQVSS